MKVKMIGSSANGGGWRFSNSYASLPERFFARIGPTPTSSPHLIRINTELASELGLDASILSSPNFSPIFSGNLLPLGSEPIAQAYAGHQFGYFAPSLGDGRAILLGEHITPKGLRVDIQLKGAGRTPFSRRGDGRAALGPVMREYIISEALHALGLPTTRSLAFATTGESVERERSLAGAVLTRVASSHVRIGTFEYFAARNDWDAVKVLADYVIKRHYKALFVEEISRGENKGESAPEDLLDHEVYREFFAQALDRQASLVAQWMLIGFIHGVMNTDNVSLAGESIDFGPCAFMDRYNPDTVFSSIDHDGRYAYGAQPAIAQWNLARLAETILFLISDDRKKGVETAEEILATFPDRFFSHWSSGMRKKLGLNTVEDGDQSLIDDLLEILQAQRLDFTNTFRAISREITSDRGLLESTQFNLWHQRWRERLEPTRNNRPLLESIHQMRATNPAYIPRNHIVEGVLASAEESADFAPLDRLVRILSTPFSDQPGAEEYQAPAPESWSEYRTFCGT